MAKSDDKEWTNHNLQNIESILKSKEYKDMAWLQLQIYVSKIFKIKILAWSITYYTIYEEGNKSLLNLH